MKKSYKFISLLMAASILLMFVSGCKDSTSVTNTGNSVGDTSSLSTDLTTSTQDLTESNDKIAAVTVSSDYSNKDLSAEYDSEESTLIELNDSGITIEGVGATASGSILTISTAGTYIISGTLSEGQIIVESTSTEKIQIVLNGCSVKCSTSSPVYIKQADKVFITLAASSVNYVSDSSSYVTDEAAETTPNGAICSRDDLTLNGTGSLTIDANYKHGIVSKDDLIITGGTYVINSVGDGIRGKDCVQIKDGNYTINAGTDGIQSSNTEDTTLGNVIIDGGTFNITAGNDGIQAEAACQINGGNFTIKTGGGSENVSTNSSGEQQPGWGDWSDSSSSSTDTASAKAIKSTTSIVITGGTFNIDSSDDSIHSNGTVGITGGNITMSSGDDGIHADTQLIINGGTILLTKSYEGLESNCITINGGTNYVTSSDDGINVSGGNDSSSVSGRPGQNTFNTDSTTTYLKITGGYNVINASGDGLDSNGSLYVDGGITIVSGPTDNGNGSLDYNSTATITGGIVIAAGSSGMVQNFGSSSTQASMIYGFSSTQAAGTMITLTDSDGNVIVSMAPCKQFQTILISAPNIAKDNSYTLYSGGSVANSDSSCADDSFYMGGTLSDGSKIETIKISSLITSSGSSSGEMGGGMGGGRR